MERATYLASSLRAYGEKTQVDAEAKKIMADKGVLSRILQGNVVELEGYSLQEIETFIENLEISKVSVMPEESVKQRPEAIIGVNTEDAVPGEGKITYDVRFHIQIPDKECIKILLNIEIQNDFYPGYDLVPRAIFYCCRMISAQKDTEFVGDDYDGIKKVYSIWLCLNAPQIEADTVTSYNIAAKNVVGETDSKRHRYDLLNVTMIGLNEKSYQKKTTELHGYLGTIFSNRISSNEKIRILKDEYGVKPTREVQEGLQKMCNMGDAIEAYGIRQGIRDSLIQLLTRFGEIPEKLQVIIEEQRDIAILKEWFQIAMEVTEIEEFQSKIIKG